MKAASFVLLKAICIALFTGSILVETALDQTASAQQQQGRPPQRQGGNNNRQGGNQGQNKEEDTYKPPEDPKVLKLYETFVLSMEKLAVDYEKANQNDKARDCYEEILRIAPKYASAQEKLKSIKMKEAIAERKPFEVMANKGWQDTGVTVIENKPLTIKATGSWSLRIAYASLPPDGVEIPEELRDFPLGSLVGVIVEPGQAMDEVKPFLVGTSKSLEPSKGGKLYLRIYDSEPDDNAGKLSITIEGTFKK